MLPVDSNAPAPVWFSIAPIWTPRPTCWAFVPPSDVDGALAPACICESASLKLTVELLNPTVLTFAMSFAVTSSIVWWAFRPLIAANRLLIMVAVFSFRPVRPWWSSGGSRWPRVRRAATDVTASSVTLSPPTSSVGWPFWIVRPSATPVPVVPSARAYVSSLPSRSTPWVSDGRGHELRDGLGDVRRLLERRVLRQLRHPRARVGRVRRVLVLELGDEQLEEVVLAELPGGRGGGTASSAVSWWWRQLRVSGSRVPPRRGRRRRCCGVAAGTSRSCARRVRGRRRRTAARRPGWAWGPDRVAHPAVRPRRCG